MCFHSFLKLLSEIFLILRRTERDMIKNVYWSLCKVPVIVVRFECNVEILNKFSKKYSNAKFHENPSSGSRIVPCGPTEMTKLMVVFGNFTNVPKNCSWLCVFLYNNR